MKQIKKDTIIEINGEVPISNTLRIKYLNLNLRKLSFSRNEPSELPQNVYYID